MFIAFIISIVTSILFGISNIFFKNHISIKKIIVLAFLVTFFSICCFYSYLSGIADTIKETRNYFESSLSYNDNPYERLAKKVFNSKSDDDLLFSIKNARDSILLMSIEREYSYNFISNINKAYQITLDEYRQYTYIFIVYFFIALILFSWSDGFSNMKKWLVSDRSK